MSAEHVLAGTTWMASSGRPVSAKCSCGLEWEGPSCYAEVNAHLDEHNGPALASQEERKP